MGNRDNDAWSDTQDETLNNRVGYIRFHAGSYDSGPLFFLETGDKWIMGLITFLKSRIIG